MSIPDFVVRAVEGVGILSPCAKSKRGVVIWHGNRFLATGFNAPPEPFFCDGSAACRRDCGKICVHAEQAALLKCQYFPLIGASMAHVKMVDGKPVPSGGPSCPDCSKKILFSGVETMWLLEERPQLDVGFVPTWVPYTAFEFHRLTLVNCGLHAARRS